MPNNVTFDTWRRSGLCIFSKSAPLTNVINEMPRICRGGFFAAFSCFCRVGPPPPFFQVMSCEKCLLRAALRTSIHSFIFSPVPSALRMKNANRCLGCRVSLSQPVTNASLDTWRGHSSPLSPGHSAPPPPPGHRAHTKQRQACMHFNTAA